MSIREFSTDDYKLIDSEWRRLAAVAEPRCKNEAEFRIIQKAFDFANFAHKNVRRMSGEPHIIHPVNVAKIVVEEIGLGYKSISAALLHDIIEYTEFTLEDIRNIFGEKIAQLVDGLNKIKVVLEDDAKNKITLTQRESIQAENFKRIILSLGDDARVVLIKLADRLHNCRTIEHLPEIKRNNVLSETMYIFIPLAHRLGFYGIKSEMENIWLKYQKPEEYEKICSAINLDLSQRERDIDEFIAPIREALGNAGYSFRLKKRIKSPYSIWMKMCTKNVSFNEIFDLYAIRIIFEPSSQGRNAEISDAYAIRDAVASLYENKVDRERDWIKKPKENGYEAIHSTFRSRSGIWVEVQIRSHRMDDIAEKGIAAHWTYKSNGYESEADTEMDRWLVKIQEVLSSKDIGAMELLEVLHNDFSSHQITIFTPKGEQKSVPAGSTALDFAYQLHTHIGGKAIACKINSVLCPASTVLNAGDKVEIITAENGCPKIEWLQFLRTKTAKAHVIDYFRTKREDIAAKGRAIYRQRLEVMGIEDSKTVFRKFQNHTQISDSMEFFFRVGLGVIGPDDFRIVCTSSSDADSEGKTFSARLSIKGMDRIGLLNDLTKCISQSMEINIRRIQLGCGEGHFDGFIELTAEDRKLLESLVSDFKKIDGIYDVVRTDIPV